MYLIVGLNNPGSEYDGTRHNVGADFIGVMLEKLKENGADITEFSEESGYDYLRLKVGSCDLMFVLPKTFMNRSGEAVAHAKGYYKVDNSETVVVCDDTNLDVGTSRLRRGGSDGGHNGLKSVISAIGEDFWRLRIGVGAADIPLEDYVLARPTDEQREKIDQIIDERAQNMLELISKNNLENDTSKIN